MKTQSDGRFLKNRIKVLIICAVFVLCFCGCAGKAQQNGGKDPSGAASSESSAELTPRAGIGQKGGSGAEVATGSALTPTVPSEDGDGNEVGQELPTEAGIDPTGEVADESSKEPANVDEDDPVQDEPDPVTHVYTNKIVFSVKDIFCETSTYINIEYDSENAAVIYYTLDGSKPDKNSLLYSEPIWLEASDSEEPNIYNLRAIAYLEDGSTSPVASHAYFVGAGIDSRYTTAVFSIAGDPKGFYDSEYGILSYAHRYGHGERYEREVYVTAVRSDGSVIFEQDCGVRIIGGDSREYPRPSLKLYAKKSYSPDRGYFPFDLFEVPRVDKPGKNVKKYGRLVLRINGDDSQNAMLRDVLIHTLARKAGFVNYEAAVPAVVYLNGEYYSLIWVREYYNDEYFRRKYGETDGEFVVVEEEDTEKHYKSSSSELERKAVNEFNRMYKKYAYSDLTNDENYEELRKLLDVEDYLRYFAVELYVANTDWPNNNLFAYRYYPNEGEATGEDVFDGRWRFLLHDLDYSSGIWYAASGNPPSLNSWKVVTTPGDKRYSPLFTALMKRADCRKYFIQYTAKLIGDVFSPESVKETIAELHGSRKAELPYYIKSLQVLRRQYLNGESSYPIYLTEELLEKNIKTLIDFYSRRPEYALKYINEVFQ